MNRRGFLGSILAACAAPAIVRADSLMRIVPVETSVLVPTLAEYDVLVGAGPSYGNRLLTIEQITQEALKILNEELPFINEINRAYDHEFMRGDRWAA